MSFVVEGRDALLLEDIVEVLGPDHEAEAEECFAALDKDGNGDVSLDEMILTISEFGRMRKSLNHSMHDVDQAIHVLDNLLLTVAFVIGVLVFVSFVTTGFGTVIAAGATSLLSLSFVFSTTAQEVLGSCIFLFVKHPFDIGDRVDIGAYHVLELQIKIGDVGYEVLAWRGADKRAENLLHQPAVLLRLENVLEAVHRNFRPFHLPDHRGVGERVQIRKGLEIDPVRLTVEEERV